MGVEDTHKLIIAFTGTGSASQAQVPSIAQEYTRHGATVLCVNYRGFGNSSSKGKTTFNEAGMYRDGMDVYNYAKNELHYAPSDIVLHGFSMGGAVASQVAANIAEQNAIDASHGKEITEKQRLGGIVLHSAINNMYQQAQIFGNNKFLARFESMAAGSYDTGEHMRSVHKYDPMLPVYYLSGGDLDDLSLDKTQLNRDKLATFANSDTTVGFGEHQGHYMRNLDGSGAGNISTVAGNLGEGDDTTLARLAKFGRAADLTNARQKDPLKILALNA